MGRLKKRELIPTDSKIKKSAMITVIYDSILIILLVFSLVIYIISNNRRNYDQNINMITNTAMAKSELMSTALGNNGQVVMGAYRYCDGKSLKEVLDYLSLISEEGQEYQLLKYDELLSTDTYPVYNGYSTIKNNGVYNPIEYRNTDLTKSFQLSFERGDGVISYSQGFTNKTDGIRYYAVFCSLKVTEDGKMNTYYLVSPQNEHGVLDGLQVHTQYADLSTAICYSDGKYMARDTSFRADNFYTYLYKYNELSIDEKNAIRESVTNDESGVGVLRYKDARGRDSIFAYSRCRDTENWYIIVSVPLSEFLSESVFSLAPTIIIIFLAILLIFNIWRLLIIVNELRHSVKRERIASQSKSSFLSRMSHEIRTPLNAVIGYNVIAKNEIGKAKSDIERKQAEMKVLDCLCKSEIASKHLLTVINDVLDMSAIESGKMKVEHVRFDFRALISSLTTVFYSQAKAKHVDFEVTFNTLTEEWFIGDQMRTNQILTNLLSNAIKFTPEGGKVRLIIQQPDALENASHIHFEVSDTGIGMTEEHLSHIWTAFEQADVSISRRFGGSGLGLSITKNLVELMGGSIRAESRLGAGSTFYVDLTFGRTEQPVTDGIYNFRSINALVVDDDISTCDYIRLLFEKCGARCTTKTSGEDALKAVALGLEHDDAYTVCLIDWKMPGMDGIETVKRIRNLTGDSIPIIILSAYDFTELADLAAEAGVDKFISKPLFQSSLFDLLATIGGNQSSGSLRKDPKVDFKGAHVLLAEDNSMNMEIAKAILVSLGLVVDSTWNGKEALEKFTTSEPGTYAAILMDVHMPEMNGYEATSAIRASNHPEAASIPIIAMTADAFMENVAEAHASGMNDHVPKPIEVTVLLETLKKYLK